jgi:hypothetical protein
LIRARSLENEFTELRRDLICKGIVAERFYFRSADPFAGIINGLNGECGGNAADRGAISITASSVYDESRAPRNVADLTDLTTIFCSKDDSLRFDGRSESVD